MNLPAMNLEAIRTIPLMQKVAFMVLVLAGIVVMFYYYVFEPKSMEIAALEGEVGKLDTEIQTLTIKVKHLDELIAAKRSGAELDRGKRGEPACSKPECRWSRHLLAAELPPCPHTHSRG